MGKRVAKLAAVPEPSSHKCCSNRRRVGSARARKIRCVCESVITCFSSPVGDMPAASPTNRASALGPGPLQQLYCFHLALEVGLQRVQDLWPALLVILVGFPCRNSLRKGSKTRLDQRYLGP